MQKKHTCKLKILGYVRNYHSDYDSQDIISHTLYHKYPSSQNYYYTKEINEILARLKTPTAIRFYDEQQFFEEEECMKRLYFTNEYLPKIKLLTEFYKYHNDLPRFGLHKIIMQILNLHYDKHRKLEYYKIQRQIELENKMNPDQPPKGIVGDRPMESQSTPQSDSSGDSTVNNDVDNILQELRQQELKAEQEISNITKINDEQQSEIMQMLNVFQISNQANGQKYQVFKKKKPAYKKQLKLDEFALTQQPKIQYSHFQDLKIPLSARFAASQICKTQKTTQSREKTETQVSRDNLVQLFNKSPQIKRIRIDNKYELSNRLKYSIPEMKQLELKIMQNMQEIEKNKISTNSKIVSLDSKALHQILSKFTQPKSTRKIQQASSFKSISNQSIRIPKSLMIQSHAKACTPRNNSKTPKAQESNNVRKSFDNQKKMKALDLKRLIVSQRDKQVNTERSNKAVPKLNLQTLNGTQPSLTSRNITLNPNIIKLNTPKPYTARCRINNLIEWQVKAMQKNQQNNSNKQ